jgi:hypothetical protein
MAMLGWCLQRNKLKRFVIVFPGHPTHTLCLIYILTYSILILSFKNCWPIANLPSFTSFTSFLQVQRNTSLPSNFIYFVPCCSHYLSLSPKQILWCSPYVTPPTFHVMSFSMHGYSYMCHRFFPAHMFPSFSKFQHSIFPSLSPAMFFRHFLNSTMFCPHSIPPFFLALWPLTFL